MAVAATSLGRLWRYNYRVLVGGGYWVLVLPIAASQVVTLWMMALSDAMPAATTILVAELMTPILGAFLVAHALSPEYRSGVGAVLACKPVSLHRVVTMRVGLAMMVAALLTLVTLGICKLGGFGGDEVWRPLGASLPSMWFLALVALTCATMFRNSLGGFGVAAALWLLNVILRSEVHPLLAIQGLYGFTQREVMSEVWLWGKGVQFALGCALLLVHARLLRRISAPREPQHLTRMTIFAAAVVALYIITGAGVGVAYAYVHKGDLPNSDATWLERKLRVYGPLPVSRLFGAPFHAYVTPPLVTEGAESRAQVWSSQLEHALQRWPGSIWADSIAFLLAVQRREYEPVQAVDDYLRVADEYPTSPFAPRALEAVATSNQVDAEEYVRLAAARRLIKEYPTTPEAQAGAIALERRYPAQVGADEVEQAARVAARVAAPVDRAGWLVKVATMQEVQGDTTGAVATARAAIAAGEAFRASIPTERGGAQVVTVPSDQAVEAAKALIARLSG